MNNDLIEILRNLNTAIAFFNESNDLIIYNEQIKSIWPLTDEFLLNKPSINDFFDVLRENRWYPEVDNFKEFKQSLQNLLTSNEPYNKKQTILLPSAKNIEQTIIRTSNGLLLLWEDTSRVWDLTYSLNNYKNIYTRLVDKNPEAILVVSSNGIVDNYNGKFAEMFSLLRSYLDEKPHIREVIEKISEQVEINDIKYEDIINERAKTVGNILGGKSFALHTKTKDYDSLVITGIALPDSSMLSIFSTPQNNTFNIYGSIYDSVNTLHNNLVLDLESVVTSSLTSILGFADMLESEYVGSINIKQKEYLQRIIRQAEFINNELNHKVQLLNLVNEGNIDKEEIDLNISLSHVLHIAKERIKANHISIVLNIGNNLKNITSNQNLLNKALSLLLLYLLEQSSYNDTLEITIEQSNKTTSITMNDSSKLPLFSNDDKKRYDVLLLFKIIELLNAKIDYSYKNRSRRNVSIIL